LDRVRLADKFAMFNDHWVQRVVAELNGQQVKIAKVKGPFVWHHHDHEDELFLVHRGILTMEFRDRAVDLHPGDLIVVPRGVEHRPVAKDEVEVVLFEPATTLNTGSASDPRTQQQIDRI
jgi:mannose-6-phosphate isomerase-like protein (cupin superfamily)